jgi:hypothetical protein
MNGICVVLVNAARLGQAIACAQWADGSSAAESIAWMTLDADDVRKP